MTFTLRAYILNKFITHPSFRSFSLTRISGSLTKVKEATVPQVVDEEIAFDKDVNVAGRIQRRRAAIPPFVKNMFLAEYNCELLAYPEVLNKQENDVLNKHLESIKRTLIELKEERSIYKSLQSLHLLSAPATAFHGGVAANLTERLRMLEEASVNLNVAKTLANHWAGLDAINMSLSVGDVDKVIPVIVEDGRPLTMCLAERFAEEPGVPDFRTTATLKPDHKWLINGGKYCSNPDSYKIVLAVTPAYKIYPFLVEPNARGVTHQSGWVSFSETPAMRLIDNTEMEKEDAEVLKQPIGRMRLYKSAISCALLKNLIVKVVEFIRTKYIGGQPYADFPLTQDKVIEALMATYASEAMIYMTAGIDDCYLNPDTNVEMAMCRMYSTNKCLEAAQDLLTVLVGSGLLPEWEAELGAIRSMLYEDSENNDALHIYSGLNCLQHAGVTMVTEVKKLRDPLHHPMHAFKRMFKNRKQEVDNPDLTLSLKNHLHPSLRETGDLLEYTVHRLRFATEILLGRYGTEVVEMFREVKRLSTAATEIYAMSAAVARASRAYCIGLPNANIDLHMANQIVITGRRHVRNLVHDIDDGEHINNDVNRKTLGTFALENKGVISAHSIDRNFW